MRGAAAGVWYDESGNVVMAVKIKKMMKKKSPPKPPKGEGFPEMSNLRYSLPFGEGWGGDYIALYFVLEKFDECFYFFDKITSNSFFLQTKEKK
jgi:hypothetical protein